MPLAPNTDERACRARDRRAVYTELMDCRRPKSEHEHEAARVIMSLMDALKASSDDLEIYVEQEYAPLRGYPSYERKRQSDLGPVRHARELLDLYKQTY